MTRGTELAANVGNVDDEATARPPRVVNSSGKPLGGSTGRGDGLPCREPQTGSCRQPPGTIK